MTSQVVTSPLLLVPNAQPQSPVLFISEGGRGFSSGVTIQASPWCLRVRSLCSPSLFLCVVLFCGLFVSCPSLVAVCQPGSLPPPLPSSQTLVSALRVASWVASPRRCLGVRAPLLDRVSRGTVDAALRVSPSPVLVFASFSSLPSTPENGGPCG